MTDWPLGLRVGPIREWPGILTPVRQRVRSQFSASWRDTTSLLRRELTNLHARNPELLVAIPAGDSNWRQDGYPRSNAQQEHPGVILSFDTSYGHLSYPTDTFTIWQDNLRAIAKSLEALRMVDRYGVTKSGEQYRGFRELEGAKPPTTFATAEDAAGFLRALSGSRAEVSDREGMRAAFRVAQRESHPDHGGDAGVFSDVMLAGEKLRAEGLL